MSGEEGASATHLDRDPATGGRPSRRSGSHGPDPAPSTRPELRERSATKSLVTGG